MTARCRRSDTSAFFLEGAPSIPVPAVSTLVQPVVGEGRGLWAFTAKWPLLALPSRGPHNSQRDFGAGCTRSLVAFAVLKGIWMVKSTGMWLRAAKPWCVMGLFAAAAVCCTGNPKPMPKEVEEEKVRSPLEISEVVSKNDGIAVDELGETDDWIELINTGTATLQLADFALSDASGEVAPLFTRELAPFELVVLFADGEPEQGERHLPFRLNAAGDEVVLLDKNHKPLERVVVPPLENNVSYARLNDGFSRCAHPTPGRQNVDPCGPPPPPELPQEVTFSPYSWPSPWPPAEGPLVLSRLSLLPAKSIAISHLGQDPVDLADCMVRIAAHLPGEPWPSSSSGVGLPCGDGMLGPEGQALIPVAEADVAALTSSGTFEGVVTLYLGEEVVDRVDFMHWPSGAFLARTLDKGGPHRFCQEGSGDSCVPLRSRPVGNRLRHLYTEGDFGALSEGGTATGVQTVKVVIDMNAGDVVHFLSAKTWPLHYTFVRQVIENQAPLDRCDPGEASIFRRGWAAFSQREYFRTTGRRYLLASLHKYGSADLHTVEFSTGDAILPEWMERAFFAATRRVTEPTLWALRPASASQVSKVRRIEGRLPLLDPNAPFRGVTYQALNHGTGYGVLRFIPALDLSEQSIDINTIVVTDAVPNDIAFTRGLITEAFQTPLAHVNVLSKNRGTPNMALTDARADDRIGPLLGQLVRLDVQADGFTVARATPEEAEAFWESQRPSTPVATPRRDLSVRGIRDLAVSGLEDLPSLGAKAAQLAELGSMTSNRSPCRGALPVPKDAFAIPVVHSTEHFQASGAQALLTELLNDAGFRADPEQRAQGLAAVQERILAHPVDASLMDEVVRALEARFGERRVRFRSSSNTEDLPNFNGAGLYTSVGTQAGGAPSFEDAVKTVWASLWNLRAYEERSFANIDHLATAMGVLVHEAFVSERANGVAVSRNVLDPIRSDVYYLNAQFGEASVTNPAPGVGTDAVLYRWGRTPRLQYQARSTLTPESVLSLAESDGVACTLLAIHNHFEPLLDPEGMNRWFAMEIEFKFVGAGRDLLVKQARPYSFGQSDVPSDCREF